MIAAANIFSCEGILNSRGYADSRRTTLRLAELRKQLEGKLKIIESGPDSLGVELLPGNEDSLHAFHELLELLKQIMQRVPRLNNTVIHSRSVGGSVWESK